MHLLNVLYKLLDVGPNYPQKTTSAKKRPHTYWKLVVSLN